MADGNQASGVTTSDGLVLEAVLTPAGAGPTPPGAGPTPAGAGPTPAGAGPTPPEAGLTAAHGAPRAIAVVTHPHPLHGGDMANPVPAGLCRGLNRRGVAVLRFNFRGTGASEGRHGGGDPERLDVAAAVGVAAAAAPGAPVVGVGYSFGADVLLGTTDDRLAGVVAVAPPLGVLPVEVLAAPRGSGPTLILSPAHDQFCDPERASALVADWPDTTVETLEGTDHFLAGGVDRVVDRVVAFLDHRLSPR